MCFAVLPRSSQTESFAWKFPTDHSASFARPALPTHFQWTAGSSTRFDGAQVELTRRSLPRQTKKAEKEDDEKDLVPWSHGAKAIGIFYG